MPWHSQPVEIEDDGDRGPSLASKTGQAASLALGTPSSKNPRRALQRSATCSQFPAGVAKKSKPAALARSRTSWSRSRSRAAGPGAWAEKPDHVRSVAAAATDESVQRGAPPTGAPAVVAARVGFVFDGRGPDVRSGPDTARSPSVDERRDEHPSICEAQAPSSPTPSAKSSPPASSVACAARRGRRTKGMLSLPDRQIGNQ
ncbi:uncharacterized protein BXZ73DRAFT_100270 [Epithele typhae]|uniref:uncharacterized protein n=1 Tax=Epithele typhae TaxID=378194 RepID=UPI002008A18B|nr:uncharacterized protein BXZ73DRAFT_100270 [Epithele typhae]KAH9936851.1 hypothetical protein BXZ73DRAFT_100270 [Epithele typhae]